MLVYIPTFGMERDTNSTKPLETTNIRNDVIDLDTVCLLHSRVQQLEKYITEEQKEKVSEASLNRASSHLKEARFSMQRALSQESQMSYTTSLISARQRIIAAERILGLDPIAQHIKIY